MNTKGIHDIDFINIFWNILLRKILLMSFNTLHVRNVHFIYSILVKILYPSYQRYLFAFDIYSSFTAVST